MTLCRIPWTYGRPGNSRSLRPYANDERGALEADRALELIVIDTAPNSIVSNAFPLLRKVDGVIVVARMGRSTRESAERLREQLSRLEAPVLGIVANAVKLRRRGKYGYGYYGGYGQAAEQPGGTAVGAGSGSGSGETA